MTRILFFIVVAILSAACGNNQPTTKTNDLTKVDSIAIKAGVVEVSGKIIENPTNAELYFERGKKYFDADFTERAEIDFRDACTLDSGNSNYFYMYARTCFSLNKTILAAQNYEKAILLDEDNLEAKTKLADLYYVTKEHVKSLNIANSILANNENYAYAHFIRGMNYKDLGDTAKAVLGFQKAIELDPNDYDSHIILARLLIAQRNKLALEYINAALKIKPNGAEAFFARATFWQSEKRYKMAITDYKRAISKNENYYECYYNVGYINFETGFLKEAIYNFDICTRMMNNYLPAYYMRGLCYELLKDKNNAKLNYEFVLNADPNYQLALLGMERLK
jgi:tetratricopeptide (TPR) repeat protein